MDIETWFETTSSHLVNAVAAAKREVLISIHDTKALRFDRQAYIIRNINTMARRVKDAFNEKPTTAPPQGKPSPGKGTSGGKTRWAGADIRSKEHKEAVRELSRNPNFVLDTLVELIDDGYDLHVKRTDAGSTVRAMFFCTISDNPNKGGGLSAEAPDAWLALAALIYKHVHLLDGRWFDSPDEGSEDDGWR